MVGWHHQLHGHRVDSRSWWWTGRPGILQFTGLQRVRYDWATEVTELMNKIQTFKNNKKKTCALSINKKKNQCLYNLVQFSHSVVSESLWPHGLQQVRPRCPSTTYRACSNSCPLIQWCHPTISSSVIPFSACFQSFPASESFPLSQFFTSGGQSIGVWSSASVLPMNIQGWFPLGLNVLISLLSKGLSRVFSNTTVQKHQCFIESAKHSL